MPIEVIDHPHPDELRAFLEGRLSGAVQERVERHIEVCSDCCDQLRLIPEDSLVNRLRAHETIAMVSESSVENIRRAVVASGRGSYAIPEELRNHPRYRITGRLGVGGMGVVYRAEHRMMERPVALKVLSPRLLENPAAVERFRVEVRAAARLSHANIVAAWDADEAGGLQMLVMEFIDGISIARQVEKAGPIPLRHACNFARQAALGLQHALEKGMVHRDIKPQNLMLTRDSCVKILDFGLARFAQEGTPIEASESVPDAARTLDGGASVPIGLTREGSALGTPEFMAPEQILNARTADIRADIFSLGCTLFFMLTGRSPFPEAAAMARLISPLHRAAPEIDAALPGTPPPLLELLKRMLATNPADRPQTPREVADALAVFVKPDQPLSDRSAPPARTASARSANAVPGNAAVTIPKAPPDRRTAISKQPDFIAKVLALPQRTRVAVLFAAGLSLIALSVSFLPKSKLQPAAARNAESGARKQILLVLPHRASTDPLLETFRRGADYFKVDLVVAGFQLQPAERLLSNTNPEDFDGLIFLEPPQQSRELRRDSNAASQLKQLAIRMAAASRPVAAIGTAVPMLAELGCLNGRRASQKAQLQPNLTDSNQVLWTRQTLVIDGPWITSADTTAAKQLLEAVVRSSASLQRE
jgi:serine/threonine protein kinase